MLPRYLCKGRHSITARKLFGGFWVVPCKTSWRLFDSDPRSTPFAGQTVGPGELRRWGRWHFFRTGTTFLIRFFDTSNRFCPCQNILLSSPVSHAFGIVFSPKIWAHDIVKKPRSANNVRSAHNLKEKKICFYIVC